MKFGFIGVGNMGGALAAAAAQSLPAKELAVSSRTAEKAQAVAARLGCRAATNRELAEQAGGHLGIVRSGIELQEIINLAEEQGIQFIWLGASRSSEDGAWYYVDGEPMDFADWDAGKPSAAGDYLLLRYRPALGYWSCTDQVDDPVSLLPESYSGRIGYVIERE